VCICREAAEKELKMENGKTKDSIPANDNSPEDEIDLLELLGVMWVNKWWIIGITGVTAVAAVLFLFLPSLGTGSPVPPVKYSATSLLIVNENSSLFTPHTTGSDTGMNSLDLKSLWERYGTLAVNILKDGNIIDTLNSETDGSNYTVIPEDLSVTYTKNSGILTVEYTSPDSGFARKTVEKVASLLNDTISRVVSEEFKLERSALNEQVEKARKSLISSEMKLRLFEKTQRLSWGEDPDPVRFTESELTEYISLKQDLVSAQRRMDFLNNLYFQVSMEDKIGPVFIQAVKPATVVQYGHVSSGSSGTKTVVAVLAAFFLSIFWVFFLNAVRNIKSDPEKLKKLKGIK